jgi:hypothetical protein
MKSRTTRFVIAVLVVDRRANDALDVRVRVRRHGVDSSSMVPDGGGGD